MRLIYLDEAGVSKHEPIAVVAGAIINADRSLIAIEDYLDSLIEKHIPALTALGSCFMQPSYGVARNISKMAIYGHLNAGYSSWTTWREFQLFLAFLWFMGLLVRQKSSRDL
jgi:hypothetical protein